MNKQKLTKNSHKVWSDFDRLSWAVNFAAGDIKKPSQQLLNQLRDELMIFLRIQQTKRPATMNTVDSDEWLRKGNLIISCIYGKPRPDDFTTKDFQRLHVAFKQIINDVADRQEYNQQSERYGRLRNAQLRIGSTVEAAEQIAKRKYPTDSTKWRKSLAFNISGTFSAGIWPMGNMLYVDGNTFDMAVLNLLSLVASQNTDSIIRCPNPECKRIFVREGKQLYCSKECSKIMTQKNWRKKGK